MIDWDINYIKEKKELNTNTKHTKFKLFTLFWTKEKENNRKDGWFVSINDGELFKILLWIS